MDDSGIKLTMREICKTAVINALPRDIWNAWTTEAGVVTFLAPAAHIELREKGAYEIYFDLSQPEGQRGSEGCVIREFRAPSFLSVTWNFPPTLPKLRSQNAQTIVGLNIQGLADGTSRVVLTHSGWAGGADWDEGLSYFRDAWGLVLARLARSFEHGPLDWDHPWRPDAA